MSLAVLNEAEWRTLDAYVALLRDRRGENLVSIRAFGSVARGEQWWPGNPLFLESGRQLGPQFRTSDQLAPSPIREVIERYGIELVLP